MLSILAAAAIVSAPPPAARNYALKFSSDAHGVTVPDAAAFKITGDMTLEAWVKPDQGIRDRPFDFIVCHNYSAHGFALLFIGAGDPNRIQFEANDPISYHIPEPWVREKWWHVAGVVQGNTVLMYVNGVKVSEIPHPNPLKEIDSALYIGRSHWGGFRGVIDEVRLWKVARSGEEIARWKDRYIKPSEPGLAAYWSFDEGKGQYLWDKVKKTKPGVLGDSTKRDPGDPKWVRGAPLSR